MNLFRNEEGEDVPEYKKPDVPEYKKPIEPPSKWPEGFFDFSPIEDVPDFKSYRDDLSNN